MTTAHCYWLRLITPLKLWPGITVMKAAFWIKVLMTAARASKPLLTQMTPSTIISCQQEDRCYSWLHYCLYRLAWRVLTHYSTHFLVRRQKKIGYSRFQHRSGLFSLWDYKIHWCSYLQHHGKWVCKARGVWLMCSSGDEVSDHDKFAIFSKTRLVSMGGWLR